MNQKKLEAIERMQAVNYELMDAFRNGLFWVVDYCEKNNLHYPDLERACSLIQTTGIILENQYQLNFDNQTKHRQNRQNHFVIVFIFLVRFSNASLISFVLLLIPIRYA